MKDKSKKSCNKGFTMVELLATIVILGVVMMIAVTSVTRMIEKAKKEYYTATEKEVKLAGESYVQNSRKYLPKRIGQKTKISLREIQNQKYIKDVKSYSKKSCKDEESYVQVFKYDEDKYSYLPYLDCSPEYTSKETIKNASPDITIDFVKSGSDTDDFRTNFKEAKAKITINGSNSESEEKNVKILGYNYVVYRNNKEVISSGSINANYKDTITVNLNLSKYTPGTIKIRVTAYNMFGLSSDKTSSMTYKDLEPPKCIIKEEDKETSTKTWTNKNRKITVGCDDGDGVGCKRPQFIKTFKTDAKIGTITIEDESGNKAQCKVSVYLDKTKPTCSINGDGEKGENDWYRSNISMALKTSDNLSGVASKDLTTSKTISYNGNTSASQIQDTKGVTWYGYVKDKAGNVNDCKRTFRKDTIPPTCKITKSGTLGENGWYKSNNVALSMTKEDTTSGVSKYGLISSKTVSYNSKTTGSQGNSNSATWYGYVKDTAGNTGKCESGNFKVDTDAPSCSVNSSGTGGNNGWYKSNATLSLSTNDNLSGIANTGLTTSTTTTYNGNSNRTQTDTKGVTWYGYVKDKAGNTRSCSKLIKVDTVPPTCTVNKSGVSGENGWYKSNNVSLSLTRNDATSGIANYGLTTSSSANYNGSYSNSQGNTNGVTWYGYVRDAAGHTGKCNTGSFKVDTTAPSCTVNASGTNGSNGWFTSNASISLSSSDDLSGVGNKGLTTSSSASYNNQTSNTQTDTRSTTWYGHIKDKAGNTRTCNKTVKVDTVNPSCSITKSGTSGSNGWYKSQNVSLSMTRNDSTSGIANYGLTTSSSTSYNSSSTGSQGNTSGVTWYGYVRDNAGRVGKCNTGSFKVDTTGPICTSSGGSSSWTKGPVTVTGKCTSDSGGSGCASTTASKTISTHTNSSVSPGKIKDNAGNETTCPGRTVRVDRKPPTCTSSGGGSSWYNSAITLTGTCSDEGSGCAKRKVTKYFSVDQKTDKSPGTVKDNVGWTTTCPTRKVKIDTQDPTCSISLSGTSGSNGWYKGSNVSVSLNTSDPRKNDVHSTIASYGLTTSSSRSYNNKASGSQGSTNGITWYGYVKDAAGNTSKCSKTFKVDTTKPKYTSVTKVNSKWSGGAAGQTWHIYFDVSDDYSGIKSRSVSYSDDYESHSQNTNPGGNFSEHIGSSGTYINFSHTTCDKAGNCSSLSKKVNK